MKVEPLQSETSSRMGSDFSSSVFFRPAPAEARSIRLKSARAAASSLYPFTARPGPRKGKQKPNWGERTSLPCAMLGPVQKSPGVGRKTAMLKMVKTFHARRLPHRDSLKMNTSAVLILFQTLPSTS